MSKHNLNVSLSFTADTSKAKANIADLSKSLQQIAKMPGSASSLFDDTKIRQASQAALELQQHLSKAVNVDTGKLDLSRFSSSLKASNQDLHQYCNTLLSTGKQGQQAFLQLAQAIAAADTPVTRVNKKLAEMGVTLKNTIRWQLSSSMLHGFMSTVSGAARYAEDLNESLNNIRIVTGQNVDQMKEFAVQANRAAKALSTTTTKYTDASLIYYQQGLSDAEVAERTEVTVKMANVARQSAEVVSDQMTAVWNNFYDGSKSLEYYADVMTALGAATATSTDEIAGGLEKFAAIGDTIGLSYEYAAGALATITSNTRQSEEVVGTALKTIFARIQGLNLGDTLEDGTTLNKYSQALDKVGISIFDQNNQIKTMDALLDEMANKWVNISKDQQIALAQTVAGTRQYTQLVALMDNWNNGDNDSMMANLNTINTSSGALDKQADIYAESWEAAESRVKAAAQNIYDSLIDDEFMIDLYNGFEKLLEGVGGFVDGLGGMKGILTLVSGIFMQRFAKEMPTALNNLKQNLMVFTGQAQTEMMKMQNQLSAELTNIQNNPNYSKSYQVEAEGITKVNQLKQQLISNTNLLSKAEYEAELKRIDNIKSMYDEATALQQVADKNQQYAESLAKAMTDKSMRHGQNVADKYIQTYLDEDDLNQQKAALPKNKSGKYQRKVFDKQIQEIQSQRQAYETELQEFKRLLNIAETDELINGYLNNETNSDEAKIAFETKLQAAISATTEEYANKKQAITNIKIETEKATNQASLWQAESAKIGKEENIQKQTKQISEMTTKMSNYIGSLKTLASNNGMKQSADQAQILLDKLSKVKTAADLDTVINEFKSFSSVLQTEGIATMDKYEIECKELEQSLRTLGFDQTAIDKFKIALEQAGVSAAQAKVILEQLNSITNETKVKFTAMSDVVTSFGSAAMQTMSAINSVKSALDTLWDEDASGLEKATAAIGALTTVMFALNSMRALSEKIITSEAVANAKATAEKLKEGVVTTAVTAKKSADVVVTGAQTGATNLWTKAVQLNAWAWSTHPIGTIITLVGTAIAAFKLLSNVLSHESDTEKLENIKEVTKAMGEAAEDAKNRYSDLLNTINNYDSAIEKLEQLKIGTNEFTATLLEANQEARKLIELYNLLPTDYHIGENGEIILSRNTLEEVQTSSLEKIENANSNASATQMKQNELQFLVDQNDTIFEAGGYTFDGKEVKKIYEEIRKSYDNLTDFVNSTTVEERNKVISNALGVFNDDYLSAVSNDLLNQEFLKFEQDFINATLGNEGLQKASLINSLSNNEEYLNSDYKNYLLNKSDSLQTEQLNLKEDEILDRFIESQKGNYVYEDGKWYKDIDGQGTKGEEEIESMSALAPEDMLDILQDISDENQKEAYIDEQAKIINSLSKNWNEEESRIADALLNKNYSVLTSEEIATIQQGGDLKNLYPFIQQLDNADELINNMRQGLENWNPGAVDLKTEIDKFAEVKKSIQDLEFGDTIDQDTFDKLGEDAQQFFTYMGDGNYQLVADAKKFYDIIMGNTSREMLDSLIESKNQIDYLRQRKIEFDEKTKAGQLVQGVKEGILTEDEARSINRGDASTEVEQKWNNYVSSFSTDLSTSQNNYSGGITQFLASADDLESFRKNVNDLQETLGTGSITNEAYAAALMSIGTQYENCENEIIQYQEAIISGNLVEVEQAKNALETAIALEETAEKYDLASESLQAYKDQMEIRNESNLRTGFENDSGEGYATQWLDELENTDINAYNDALNELSVVQARLTKGFQKLGDNWEDWDNILSDNEASIEDIAEAMEGLKEVLADILNWDSNDVELLPADFSKKYRKQIDDVYNGVDGAIEKLQGLATAEYIATIGLDNNLTQEGENAYNDLLNFLNDMPDLEVGMTLDDIGITDALNQLLIDSAITVDQMNDILSKIGFEPEWGYEEITIDGAQAQTYLTNGGFTKVNEDGSTTWVPLENRIEADGLVGTTVKVPVLKSKSNSTVSQQGSGGTYLGGGGVTAKAPATRSKGGGGGGSKKPAEKVNKSDVVKRYKEIDDKLASNTSAMNKANTAAEGLWGPERFKNMRKSIDLMEEENKLLKERMDLSKQYMEEDRAALDEAAANAGLNFTFNSEGYITNYTEQMTKLYEEQAALIERANADGGVDESEQEQLDAMEKRVNAVTEAIENYEASLEESISDEEKFLENQREIWQANFDLWNEELELEITINEKDLKLLEYFMNKNSDSVFNNAGIEGYDGMIGDYKSNTKEYQDSLKDLEEQYANGDIGPEQYKEGIADLIDRALGDAEAMADLKEQLQNRLADEISLVEDELAALNEQFDHLNSVLDHYASIMELTGKSKDFDAMGDIYRSQADNFKNSAEVYQQQYEMYKDEADKYYELMQSAEYGSNEYETYKASWEAAQAAQNEAQEQMLANTEEWAQAMRACIENEFEKIADVLEKSLTAEYGSMDNMITAMERANSLQEEYLTTTNKVYETDKLMRQAQQEIDKSTNSVAKKKLKSYIEETQQLQDQTELSQYELEIQQAKYDLILAEIALEEAQNAKSTVRLQRDAEGNFGYVYTADSEKIAEAEQGLEDAQNRLYNIALEGANDYSQKQMETLQEMYDALKELQIQYLDGEFETEQAYQKAMEDTKKFYYEKLEQYSSLHAVALATDSRVIADAWSSDFNDIIGKTEEWKDAVELYTDEAGKLIAEWAGIVSTALANTGLDDTAKATEEVDKKSKDLRDTIIGEDGESGLVSALEKEIDAISAATKGMIDYQKEIDKAIESNEKLAAQLNEDYKVMPEVKEEPQPEPEETKNNTNDTNKDTGNGNEKSGPSWDKVYSAYQKIISGEWGNGYENRVSKGKAAGYSAEEVQLAQELVNKVYSGLSLQSAKSALGFNTGGYTGAWSGDEGKLAFLHQKELVLNAGDTENFLMSMEVLERILRVIDLQTFSSQFGGLLTSPGLQSQGEQTIEQYITIEANFPEATDRFEIEEAFNSLANLASQYVNRK